MGCPRAQGRCASAQQVPATSPQYTAYGYAYGERIVACMFERRLDRAPPTLPTGRERGLTRTRCNEAIGAYVILHAMRARPQCLPHR
jgi:hypothetical protein